jgi:hypothetical protein
MALPGRCGYSSAPVTTGDSHSCGVTTAFEPIVDNIIASTALYWAVVIWFFDRAVQKTGRTMHTAIVIEVATGVGGAVGSLSPHAASKSTVESRM